MAIQHPNASQAHAATPAWPDWIEDKRIDDALVAEAYEAAGPARRAAVKTAIALFQHYSAPETSTVHEETCNAISGFWRSRTTFPAPWAVIAFQSNYTSAARLLAAVMPAVLSGVQLIAACCIDGTPDPGLLAALDIAGVGDILSLSQAELSALLEETQPGPGRLVLLHTGRLDMLRTQARSLHIPLFEERRAPNITITQPELFDLDVLRFAQGDEPVTQALESPAPSSPDVLYASPKAVRSHCQSSARSLFSLGMAPLAIAPGCEGFWMHHGLGRSFFHTHRVGYGVVPPKEDQ